MTAAANTHFLSIANALVWLGGHKESDRLTFSNRPPVFALNAALSSLFLSVTYSREHQKWVLLTNSEETLHWFADMPWKILIVGKGYLMPVSRDIDIPSNPGEEKKVVPKFALRLTCIDSISSALGQQETILVGRYKEEDNVISIDYVADRVIKVLNRLN